MQAHKSIIVGFTLLLATAGATATASAQSLYKYTDKNGKVTYSDKAPKPGEKAELVKIDSNANIISPPANKVDGITQRPEDLTARASARESKRDQLKGGVDAARSNLERAKKALEAGLEPMPEERQIVVRQGGNGIIRKPEYYERISGLEAAIKQAEENLAKAEEQFRRDLPN